MKLLFKLFKRGELFFNQLDFPLQTWHNKALFFPIRLVYFHKILQISHLNTLPTPPLYDLLQYFNPLFRKLDIPYSKNKYHSLEKVLIFLMFTFWSRIFLWVIFYGITKWWCRNFIECLRSYRACLWFIWLAVWEFFGYWGLKKNFWRSWV